MPQRNELYSIISFMFLNFSHYICQFLWRYQFRTCPKRANTGIRWSKYHAPNFTISYELIGNHNTSNHELFLYRIHNNYLFYSDIVHHNGSLDKAIADGLTQLNFKIFSELQFPEIGQSSSHQHLGNHLYTDVYDRASIFWDTSFICKSAGIDI